MVSHPRCRRAAFRHLSVAGALIFGICGCSDAFSSEGLTLTITVSDTEVRLGAPVTIRVTALNLGDSVVWGRGSSSCQLGAVAQVGADERRIDFRACTEDLAPQGLGPDKSRSESWTWNAVVFTGNVVDTLPPGAYQIRAVAGDAARSSPRTITVVGPPDE